MKISININKILFYILLVNPVFSFLLDNTNIHYFYIIGPLLLVLLIKKNCKKYLWGKVSLVLFSIVSVSVLLALLRVVDISDLGKINNHLFSFLDAILILIYMTEEKNIDYFNNMVIQKMNIIKGITLFITIAEVILLVTRKGYMYNRSWGGNFFHGTNSMPHTLSYLMIVLLIYICLIIKYDNKKIWGILSLVPLYAIFESGARSTLILCLPMLLILSDLIFTKKQKNIMIKIIFSFSVALVVAFLLRDKIMSSDLWNKIVLRQSSGNNTAGRMYIWKDLLNRYFSSLNPIIYLFGMGDQMTYTYNLQNPLVKASVWAHNDFIQVLVGKGLICLILYFYSLIIWGKNAVKNIRNIYSIVLISMVPMSAVINGFYSYRDFVLAVPFLTVLARFYNENKSDIQRNKNENFTLRKNILSNSIFASTKKYHFKK